MDSSADGKAQARSLAAWLEPVAFSRLRATAVTTLLTDSIAGWGRDRGWEVRREVPSRLQFPGPDGDRAGRLDLVFHRQDGPPVAVEIDRADKRRSVRKLLAEAEAGLTGLWVRWGFGPFPPLPEPLALVGLDVRSSRDTLVDKRLYTRLPASTLAAPAHSVLPPPSRHTGAIEQAGLF